MTDLYLVPGGTGNWSSPTNWSASDGGASGAGPPTSADHVHFTDNSSASGTITLTIDAPANCADFICAITNTAKKMTLALGAQTLTCTGSWTSPGSTLFAQTGGGTIILAPAASGKTFSTANVSFSAKIQINGPSGDITLGSAITTTQNSASSIDHVAGGFNTGNFNITAVGFQSIGTNTRSLTLGTSTINVASTSTCWNINPTGLTFSGASSTIIIGGAGGTFVGGGLTYGTVSGNGAPAKISDANTITNLNIVSPSSANISTLQLGADLTITGAVNLGSTNTAVKRTALQSTVVGVARTLTCNGTLSAANDIDFRDINLAGSAFTAPLTGTRFGDCGGNSNITFPAPKTVYFNLSGSTSWSSIAWALTNNGAPALNNFPLPQDIAVITEAGGAGTIAMDRAWNIGSVNMADGVSNRVSAVTITNGLGSGGPTIYGNVTLFSALTFSGAGTYYFAGRSTQTIISVGVAFTGPPVIMAPGSTVKAGDDLNFGANAITVTAGNLDDNGHNITAGSFLWGTGNLLAGLVFNGGIWAVSGSGTAWNANSNSTNKSTTRTVATGKIRMTSASAKTFAGGAFTYPTLVQAAAGALTIQQSNRFNDLQAETLPSTVTPTNGTTQTLDNFTGSGSDASHLLTINTPSAGNFASFSKPSGVVSVSYVSLKDNHALGGAIWNALTANGNVNVSGNSGWNFVQQLGAPNFFFAA